jgi:hypothetical protein
MSGLGCWGLEQPWFLVFTGTVDLEIWRSFAIEREKEAHGLIGDVDFEMGFAEGLEMA